MADSRSGTNGRRAASMVEELRARALVVFDDVDLPVLLEASEIQRDVDTCLAGRIRILAVDGLTLVQEQTPEGDVLVRRVDTREAAEAFVEDRLATYERMWDGCGCKVDYGLPARDR